MAESYDVIIIGTGAGGGTPADTLDVVDTSLFPSIGAVHPALTMRDGCGQELEAGAEEGS